MLLFRALAKNMAPMTNADESPTNRLGHGGKDGVRSAEYGVRSLSQLKCFFRFGGDF